MTVSKTTNKISYTGNGVAVEFAIPFPFLDIAHLKVYQLLNDIQTQRTDWNERNGNLVFESAPENGAKIIIMREIPLTQETDYRENEILPAETLERNFDRLTMQIQQVEEKTQRAVTVDVFDNTQAADLLPEIHKNVSKSAVYAQEAKQQAQSASVSAQSANEHAETAKNKALEIAGSLENKLNRYTTGEINPKNPAYVIESYSFENDFYRVWSDGLIEQGGLISAPDAGAHTVNLIRPFSSTNYHVNIQQNIYVNAAQANNAVITKTTDCFTLNSGVAGSVNFTWEATGF